MRRALVLSLGLLLGLLPLACTPATSLGGPVPPLADPGPTDGEPAGDATAAAPAPWPLPEDWTRMPRPAFERHLARLAADRASVRPTPLPTGTLDGLTDLAGDPDRHEPALRAALLLATLDDPGADERLLTLLERREERPERPADAALVNAAARLGLARPVDDDRRARLAALALDPDPHPDLEVRVECARSALLLGDESVGPFLMKVTRLGTPLGLERDGPWRSAVVTTWSRHRAAEALAEHLGVVSPYHGDATVPDRERGALALEAFWNERP